MNVNNKKLKEEITKNVVKTLCEGFIEAIIVGMEENEDRFPYTTSVINCITELRSKGIKVNINIFTDITMDTIYKELSNYIAK